MHNPLYGLTLQSIVQLSPNLRHPATGGTSIRKRLNPGVNVVVWMSRDSVACLLILVAIYSCYLIRVSKESTYPISRKNSKLVDQYLINLR